MPRTLLDGRYELLRNVASGGMGAVYEARHIGTGQRVAVKVVAPWDGEDSEVVMRFQREAQAAGSIDTPHIVHVIDAGRDRSSGVPFIVMDFLEGCDLNRVVSELGALRPQLAVRLVSQACVGLMKAHAAGIIHRDIKPANLFVARESDDRLIVKVLDFGIAKLPQTLLATFERAHATTTGKLLGSPQFMSPEQAKGLRTLDHRTDLWSLGAVLYTLLAGFPPFGEFETIGQIILAICSRPPRDIDEVAPRVQPELARVVRRAMAMDAADRYASARDMYAELRALSPEGTDVAADELKGFETWHSQSVISPIPEGPREPTLLYGAAVEEPASTPEEAQSAPARSSKRTAISEGENTLRSESVITQRNLAARRPSRPRVVAIAAGLAVVIVAVIVVLHRAQVRTLEASEAGARPAIQQRPVSVARALAAVPSVEPNALLVPHEAEPPRKLPQTTLQRANAPKARENASVEARQPSATRTNTASQPQGTNQAITSARSEISPHVDAGTRAPSFSTLDKNFE